MPNDYVDLGYFNGIFQGWSDGNEVFDEPTFDAFMIDLRDRVQTKMEAENAGQNWQVSRVFKWSSGNIRGYGFMVRRLVSGVPDGREWSFIWGGPNLGLPDRYCEPREIFEGSTTVDSFYRNSEGSYFGDGCWAMHHHKGAIDVTATGELRYTGQPQDTETITIDGKVYQFQTTLTDVDGNVQIGATADDSFNNLAAAIDLSGVAGTDYALSMTALATVTAANDPANDVMTVTAVATGAAGNSIAVASGVPLATWDGTLLYGGTLFGGHDAEYYGVDAIPEDAWDGTTADLAPPNVLPSTSLSGFLPTGNAHRPAMPGWYRSDFYPTERNANCFVWNHELPFMAWYQSDHDECPVKNIFLMGDIVVPRRAVDRWIVGNLALRMNPLPNSVFISADYFDAARPDGTVDTYDTLQGHVEYYWQNQPRGDGTYDKDPIKVINNINDKGYIDKNVYAVQGRNDDQQYALFDATYGRMMSLGDSTVVPWVVNAPIPFTGWPIELQKHPLDLT